MYADFFGCSPKNFSGIKKIQTKVLRNTDAVLFIYTLAFQVNGANDFSNIDQYVGIVQDICFRQYELTKIQALHQTL